MCCHTCWQSAPAPLSLRRRPWLWQEELDLKRASRLFNVLSGVNYEQAQKKIAFIL